VRRTQISVTFLTAVVLCISLTAMGLADSTNEFQLLYPNNNVSSRPILEFRSRSDTVTGHAFVAIGRELDNGTKYYYAIGGFYPKEGTGKLEMVKNMIYGPGEVKYKIPDLRVDEKFQVYLTPEQARTVDYIFKYWNEKQYSLMTRNCVSLMKDVANATGLKYDPAATTTPKSMLESLQKLNTAKSPVEFGERDKSQQRSERSAIDSRDRGVPAALLDQPPGPAEQPVGHIPEPGTAPVAPAPAPPGGCNAPNCLSTQYPH
jgi:hypothetical protein